MIGTSWEQGGESEESGRTRDRTTAASVMVPKLFLGTITAAVMVPGLFLGTIIGAVADDREFARAPPAHALPPVPLSSISSFSPLPHVLSATPSPDDSLAYTAPPTPWALTVSLLLTILL